ncbi:esterase [Candidatus Saccharibacteria bacterium]|nr:esterase [Candidatus Saccharibacteria bacterium]
MNPNSPGVTPLETPTGVAEQNSQKQSHKNILKIAIPVATILLIVVATFLIINFTKSNSSSNNAVSVFTDEERSKLLENYEQDNEKLTLNSANWSYDSSDGVYYQIGVPYLANTESSNETMGIYVPEEYMSCKETENDLYSCEINKTGKKGDYTAETAPIVIPVNTPGYSAQSAPSSYSYNTISSYMDAGFIYLYPGIRGRGGMGGGGGAPSGEAPSGGAPSGEMPSGERPSGEIPSGERPSGNGPSMDSDNSNQTTSNSSDSSETASGGAPYGVTDLKAAVRYYRFNSNSLPGDATKMISFGHSGGGAQSAILGASGDSTLYYPYLTSLGAAMKDTNGNLISDAIYGSMDWCPITNLDIADAAYEWNMGQFSSSNTRADDTFTGTLSDDLAEAFAKYINELGLKDEDGSVLKLEESSDGIYLKGSYYDNLMSEIETSYNNYLADSSNSSDAKPTSLEDFVKNYKSASKTVGAFDSPEGKQTENNVFGDGSSEYKHFDSFEAELIKNNAEKYSSLSGWDSSYPSSFESDLAATDALGVSTKTRVDMYNPMYYLDDYYGGFGSSNVAKYWRIRSGIEQGDTALTTELNLKLALNQIESVEDVDFAMVWGKGHTEAERTGNATSNFISWVKEITK